jgi:hypothetical protein
MTEPLLAPTDVPMPDCQLVVVSHRRAGRVHVSKMLPPDSFVVVVNVSQVEAYERAQPELQVVGFDGTETEKMTYCEQTWKNMIWMDDDYMGVQHFEHGPGEKPCWLTPNDVLAMFHRTAWDAAQAGAFLFGWARSDIRNYMDWRPFQMLGVPRGCIGVLDGFEGLGYHPELTSAGDYWQALLCLYHHRYMWMDNRYRLMSAPDGKYAENRGGEATNRTLGSECKDALPI